MEFRKSGFGDEDAANLALVATMYQNVADESISAADSAGFIIAQMKAFNIEAENATHIIDAVNEISNNYAVSSSDLANNLGKVSSALAVGGNSFEEVLGMMTAITEITRNSSTAARGLVSVQSRFNQIIDETSSTGQKLTDFYNKHGIAIKDQNGQLRNLYDVLKDTAGIWDTLDENEQKYFLNIQAGANQTRNLAALMENFGVAVSATATAMNSAGSAAEENGRVMESLQKKIDNLKAAWENFSTNTITKDFIGGIIDAGTQLLTFVNTDLGQAIAKALLFGTTIGSATGFIGTFVGKIFELATEMKKLSSVVDGPTTAIGKFLAIGTKGKWTLIALGIAGITAAVIALVSAFGSGESAFDKYMSKAEKAAQKQEEYQQSVDDSKKKLEELNDIPYADRTSEQQHEIEVLKDQIEQYEKLIELEKQRQSEALKGASDEAIGHGVKMGVEGHKIETPTQSNRVFKTLTDEQKAEVAALPQTFDNVTEAIDAYANALGLSWVKADGTIKTMEEMRNELALYGYGFDDVTATLEDSAVEFQNLANSINQGVKPTQEQLNLAKSYIDANKQIADSLLARINNGDELSEAESRWLLNYNNLLNAYENGQDAVNKYNASVKTAQDTLSKFPEFERASSGAIETVAKALINNADLGIKSTEQLKSALQNLAEGGVIDLSRIGNIDEFIQKLMEVEGFDFSPKTVDVTTDESDAIQGIDEVASELESIPENIVANISTTSDAEAMTGALDNLNAAIDKLQGKSVDVTIGAKTDSAITALGDLKSQIEGTATDVDINAVGNDMATPMLERINSLAAAISRNISVVVSANASQAISALRTIQNYHIGNKSFSVYCGGNALSVLSSILSNLNALHDKTIHVHAVYTHSGTPPKATGSDWVQGGTYLINDGAPVNGSRAELVVSDGVGRIYNDGDTTIQDLPQGSKIYTAAETQNILKDRGLTVDDVAEKPIPAMANGTNNNKYPDYRLDPTYSGVTDLSGSGEDLKKNFDEWLKEKKHFLNMDVITEAQYYRDLEIMNERYLKNMADYRDDYWQHEEEIYNWRNQSLEEQIALEEKLEELAKAKTQKVLTYTGGRFQYLQNIEAIAAAQREVDKITGKYADGTMGARGGLSLVGEEGPELRVLKNGDGIIPADATKNLLSLSRFSAKDIIGAAKSNIMQYAFNISNLSLPNVHSPEDFIDGLRNMAYQYSFSRA